MADPFIGEIKMFAGNYAPRDWAFCNGALVAISDYDALFSLIGTTYGGDGISTFGLPDLRSRVPVHIGSGFVIGQKGGAETVTLTPNQLPAHSHLPQAAIGAPGNPVSSPAGNFWSGWTGGQFTTEPPTAAMSTSAIGQSGGSQPHENMVPFQVVNFIIALTGIFPSRS